MHEFFQDILGRISKSNFQAGQLDFRQLAAAPQSQKPEYQKLAGMLAEPQAIYRHFFGCLPVTLMVGPLNPGDLNIFRNQYWL